MTSSPKRRSYADPDDSPTKLARLSDEFNQRSQENGYEEFKSIILSINASQEKDVSSHFAGQLQELTANVSNCGDISQIVELIFDANIGIIKFLKSRSGQRSFDEPKETVFAALKDLLANKSVNTALIVEHCVKLKDAINCIWRSSRESVRLQAAALQCLISLMENYGSLMSAYDFEASDLYQKLLSSSEKISIYSNSVRGEMLQLLGMIAYVFKDSVFLKNTQDQLIWHLLKYVKTQVESAHKQIEASILAGSIKSVDYFLRAYGSDYVGCLVDLEEMLGKIVNPKISITFEESAGVAKKIKRREFQRAALTLVEHHGALFKDQLFQKYHQWFTDLIAWCKSSYREDSDRGKATMLSFLQVICDLLIDPTRDYTEESSTLRGKVIEYLAVHLVSIFENSETGSPAFDVASDGLRLITTISLDPDPSLKDQLNSELFAKVEKCLNEIKRAERGPGYVEELSAIEAGSLLPNLSSSEEVDFTSILLCVSDQRLGSLVTKLVQTVKEDEELRQRHGSNLVTSVISVWGQIEFNFESDFVFRTLCDMLILDEDLVGNSALLCQWWQEVMGSMRKTIQEKMFFTEFLPFFGMSSNSAVRKMISDHIAVMNQRLLEQDKGAFLMIKLLDGILSICRRYPKDTSLLNSLAAFFITLATSITQHHAELQDECLRTCHHYPALVKTQKLFENFARNVEQEDKEANTLLENMYTVMITEDSSVASLFYRFCIHSCLANLPTRQIEIFAENNIFSIVSNVTKKWETESDLISKTTALWLYETIASLTASRKDYLRNVLNDIYVRYLPEPPQKPAEVIRVVINTWLEIKKSTFVADKSNSLKRKIQYEFNGAAFNAVATILIAGNYSQQLFMNNLLDDYTGMRTWEKIIDSEMEIFFPVIRETIPETDEELPHHNGGGEPSRPNIMRPRPHFDLTTHAGRFDFTGGSNLSLNHSYSAGKEQDGMSSRAVKEGGYFLLQNHPCLDRIQKIVQHLQSLPNNTAQMQLWMKAILIKFTSGNVPVNVKLFLCGVVLNSQNVFKPFGAEFMKSIITVILSGKIQNHFTENSTSLNSFERELIGMLLDWNVPEIETQHAEELFCYCLPKVLYKRKDIQQCNLELLTKISASWIKTKFSGETYAVILNLFEDDDKTLALYVVQAILKGGVLPCDEVNLRIFIGRIGQHLSSSLMQNFELAAEGFGLLLKVCRQLGVSHFSKTVSYVRRFFCQEKGRIQPFVMMLNAVGRNYPRILVSFKAEIEHLQKHKPEVEREAIELLQIVKNEEEAAGGEADQEELN